MPATIRASHKRLLVLLLVAALLSAVSASAHLPQPTAPRLISVDHARLDLAWAELELSQKPRLGDLRAKNAFRPPGNLCKSLNALVDSSALRSNPDRNVFFFQGRERDPATGLYDFRNRWYDTNLARFVSFDPKPYVDGPNAYGAFIANPVNVTDPTGEVGVAGGIVSVLSGAALSYLLDQPYGLMDAAQDFAFGAAGAGIAAKVSKLGKAMRLGAKASSALQFGAELGVNAAEAQVRNYRETGEFLGVNESLNQGLKNTLVSKAVGRGVSAGARVTGRVLGAAGRSAGVAASRLKKIVQSQRSSGATSGDTSGDMAYRALRMDEVDTVIQHGLLSAVALEGVGVVTVYGVVPD